MARDTTISPSAAGPSVISAEAGVIDVTRLRVALARLSRRLRRHELAGLTPTQLAALSTVEQAGPLRLGDLAAAEGIAPSTLTRLVAVLEELGYVRRDADPKDARASTLAITVLGHETLERLRAENSALLAKRVMLLTPEHRIALAALRSGRPGDHDLSLEIIESFSAGTDRKPHETKRSSVFPVCRKIASSPHDSRVRR